MGCGRVAEAVRADGRSALDPTDEVGHDGPDLAGVDPAPAPPEEEGALPGVACEQRTAVTQVLIKPLSCGNAVRNDALAVALAPDPDQPAAVVQGIDGQADELSDP